MKNIFSFLILTIAIIGCAQSSKIAQNENSTLRSLANADESQENYIKVSEHIQGIQRQVAANKQVLVCRTSLGKNALDQGTSSTALSFNSKSKIVRINTSALKEDFVISLDSKKGALISTDAQYAGHGGFSVSSSSCNNGNKEHSLLYYAIKDGPGIIGSQNPLAVLEVTHSRRESLQENCSVEKQKTCDCGADLEYVEREKTTLTCEIYSSPFSQVNGELASHELQNLYKSFSESMENAKKIEGEELFQSSSIKKMQVDSSFRKKLTTSMLWSSVPTLADENVFSTLFTKLNFEKSPKEPMFNPNFNASAVQRALGALKQNSNLHFYHFSLDESRAEHDIHVSGWIIADSETGELIVSTRTTNYTRMRDLLKKKRSDQTSLLKNISNKKRTPANGNLGLISGSKSHPFEGGACEGEDVKLAPYPTTETNSASWKNSKCWEKNNTSFAIDENQNSVSTKKMAGWFDVLDEFIQGSELKLNSRFEAAGVCFDLDGGPRNSADSVLQMSETKRTPIYIIKDGLKVSIYNQQVLQRTNHGIWPPGKVACEGKELEYKTAAHNDFDKNTYNSFATEALRLPYYQDKCFTHYRGFANLAVNKGSIEVFLRQTNRGIVMLWPRPQDPLDNFESVQLMCVFSKDALRSR